MQYEQLKTPNLDPVVYEDGKPLLDWCGWCLATVETAFGTARTYPTAWAAWGGTQYRHEDRNWPIGVYFPIWFSGYGGDGHVAIAYVNPNGNMGIWTSPDEHTPYFYTGYTSVDRLAEGYHVSYVGWSEDLAGTRLIQPKPQPAPIPPPPLYTISTITPKQIVLNKQPTKEWNLGLSTLAEIEAAPFSQGNLGDIKTIVAELHTTVAGIADCTYYLENANSPVGWNAVDCNDYTPSVPPAPYTPPAGPIQSPKPETYQLLTSLPYYASSIDCQNKQNSKGVLVAGNYYVWGKEGESSIYYNLGTTNTTQPQQWINILDNKAPVSSPVVSTPNPSMTTAEIRASYRAVSSGPIDVQAKQTILVADIVGSGSPITVTKGTNFRIYGTFRKNTQWYAMPKINASDPQASNYMYGIPIAAQNTLEPFLEDLYGIPEQLRETAQAWYDKAIATIEGIWHPKRSKK